MDTEGDIASLSKLPGSFTPAACCRDDMNAHWFPPFLRSADTPKLDFPSMHSFCTTRTRCSASSDDAFPSLLFTDAIISAYVLLSLASNAAFLVVSLSMLPPLYASKESESCLISILSCFGPACSASLFRRSKDQRERELNSRPTYL